MAVPKAHFAPQPPPEVSRFFKNKGVTPSFSWEDVWQEEHALTFTVAKAMELDVIDSIRSELQRAIDEGRTLRDFRKDLEPTLQRLGWWGKKTMVDPLTGEEITAQLGSPRRLRTIYDANMRSARAAGQWERAQRTKAGLPYFIYELGPSREHRADHLRYAGLVLPVDDPFWDTHMPPNGWGCKCRVRQITKAEADEHGGPSTRPRVQTQEYVNKRTGEVVETPVDVDPGWASNPGKERKKNLEAFLAGRLEQLPQRQARVAVADLVDSFRFEGIFNGEMAGVTPVGVLPPARAAELGSATRVVSFSDYTAAKGLAKHADIDRKDYSIVQHLMEHGDVITDKAGHVVFVGKVNGHEWKAVVKRTKDGRELYLQTLHRLRPGQADKIRTRQE